MRILRVFPRRTLATPSDELVRVASLPGFLDEADEVHVSVAFTYDLPRAERLAKAWRDVAPTSIGGPATGEPGGEFVPGRYLAHGYTITSRGCPNRCWFCSVPEREGGVLRELPVRPGWNVLDDNLLACYEPHVREVLRMLKDAKRAFGRRPQFTGGLEAARLLPWHVEALRELRPEQMFFAYDEPRDLEPLRAAGRMLLAAGWTRRTLRAYVLCGYPGDTTAKAWGRMVEAWQAGFLPMAMVWRNKAGKPPPREWSEFANVGCRPARFKAALGGREEAAA